MGIITGILSTILEWLNEGLFNGGLQILKAIIGETMYYLSYENIISLLPSIVKTETVEITLLDVGKAVAWGILIVLFLVEAIKMITLPLNDRKPTKPINMLVRFLSIGIILVFFDQIMAILTMPFEVIGNNVLEQTGAIAISDPTAVVNTGWTFFDQLVNGLASTLMTTIDLVGSTVHDVINLFGGDGLVGNSFNDIAGIVLSFTLFTSILGAGLIIIERYLSLAITMVFGPIFISLGVSDSTASSTKSWIQTVLVQFGAVLLSWFALFMFLRYYNEHILIPLSQSKSISKVFDYAMCIALLQIIKNSEKYFNALGLRTITNKDSAGAVKSAFHDMSLAMRLPKQIIRTGKSVAGGAEYMFNLGANKSVKNGGGIGFNHIDKNTNGTHYKDNVSLNSNGKPLGRNEIEGKVKDFLTNKNNTAINGLK